MNSPYDTCEDSKPGTCWVTVSIPFGVWTMNQIWLCYYCCCDFVGFWLVGCCCFFLPSFLGFLLCIRSCHRFLLQGQRWEYLFFLWQCSFLKWLTTNSIVSFSCLCVWTNVSVLMASEGYLMKGINIRQMNTVVYSLVF